jgi:DNA polymerase (family 10)
MPTARNAEIAELLENIADMLEIKGDSPYRIRAYREAARSIESLTEDVADIIERGELQEVKGIGESIAAKIEEFVRTGHSSYYEELTKQINPSLAELLKVPGVGPKKAKLFYEKLGIDSVDKLEQAAKEHKISKLPGIGPKTEENILEAIEWMRSRSERTPLGLALPTALPFLESIRRFPEVVKADLAGSLRRMKETIGDLDLLAASENPAAVIEKFINLPMVKNVLGHGPTKGTVVTHDNLQVDLRVVKPDEYGAALQYFTGSKAHNIKLRTIAESKGLKVNEYGIFRLSDNKRIAGETEESMYETLGMKWMEPELREDQGEIEAAMEGRLPHLVKRSDIKGDLHIHTKWSDGAHTPEEMVKAAREKGLQYIAFADHSVSMGFIHGLTVDRIREQRALIDELNEKYPDIRILQGIEVNIRADGSLDYDEEVLEAFDIVTASVHSGLGMPAEKMTERLIKAVSNPHVDILGHPTGRVINKREPYELDLHEVLKVAAETGTAVEINSQPDRLDLKDTDARLAKEMGVMLAIDSDAHSAEHYQYLDYGVATARRGWVEPQNVLNALPLEDLLDWLSARSGTERAERLRKLRQAR